MAQKKFRHLKYTSHHSVDPSVHRSVIRNGLSGRVAVKSCHDLELHFYQCSGDLKKWNYQSRKEPSDFNSWCNTI